MGLTYSAKSYPPTMALFIGHWGITNAARSAPLVLKNGETVQIMTGARDAINAAIGQVNASGQNVDTVSRDRKDERAALRVRMNQFRKAADYLLEGKNYAAKIAALPPVSASDKAYTDAADTMIYAWDKANAADVVSGGLKLDEDYTLTDFRADVTELQGQPLESATATLSASGVRDDRNDLLLPARQLMKLYMKAIRAFYKPDSNEVKTLPKLWEQHEENPDAPKVKVEYTPGSSTARVTWAALRDPNIAHLFVNIAPGTRYLDKNVRRLAELAPNIISYDLPEGTITPGSTHWIKVVIVDEDGDEIASNAVKIERET